MAEFIPRDPHLEIQIRNEFRSIVGGATRDRADLEGALRRTSRAESRGEALAITEAQEAVEINENPETCAALFAEQSVVDEVSQLTECSESAVRYAGKLVDEHLSLLLFMLPIAVTLRPRWDNSSQKNRTRFSKSTGRAVGTVTGYKLNVRDRGKHHAWLGTFVVMAGERLAEEAAGHGTAPLLLAVRERTTTAMMDFLIARQKRSREAPAKPLAQSAGAKRKRAARRKAGVSKRGVRSLGAWLAASEKSLATRMARLVTLPDGSPEYGFTAAGVERERRTALKWRRLVGTHGKDAIYDRRTMK